MLLVAFVCMISLQKKTFNTIFIKHTKTPRQYDGAVYRCLSLKGYKENKDAYKWHSKQKTD